MSENLYSSPLANQLQKEGFFLRFKRKYGTGNLIVFLLLCLTIVLNCTWIHYHCHNWKIVDLFEDRDYRAQGFSERVRLIGGMLLPVIVIGVTVVSIIVNRIYYKRTLDPHYKRIQTLFWRSIFILLAVVAVNIFIFRVGVNYRHKQEIERNKNFMENLERIIESQKPR